MTLRVLAVTHVFPRTPEDANAPFLLRHVRGLAGAGVDVRVVAPHDAGLPLEHEVCGIPVRRVRYGTDEQETIAYRGEMHLLARRPRGAWRALRLMLALRRAVRHEVRAWRPDAVEVHWLVPSGLALVGARLGVPVQVDVHGTDVALVQRGAVTRLIGRVAITVADRVAAMSEPLARDLAVALGRMPDHVQPMPGAPPPPPPAAPAVDPGRVVAVGRLVPEKGHADLIDAVARLRRAGRDVRVTIVGEGPERPRLAARAAAAGVPLELTGARSPADIEPIYASAAVVVVPSRREGYGLVAAEALARQRPVVATAVGGLADVVTTDPVHGPTGWSVPSGDAAALARAIAAAMDDPEEAARRAAAGAARVAARWSADALGVQAASHLAALAASRARDRAEGR